MTKAEPSQSVDVDSLHDFVPFRVSADSDQPSVDWVNLGGQRFTEPFFEQTIARCLRTRTSHSPHRTSMERLREVCEQQRALRPTGFIFHMSRCGSTLVSQMLAAVERCIAISEAPPIDQILGAAPDAPRADWLRWMLHALGRPRHGEEFFFVKFDAWHVLDLPLIVRAFPDTPWMFLYRDPVEVLVSQQRERGVQVIPTALSPTRFGLDIKEPWITRLDEYAARVLGRICAAALQHQGCGRGVFVNFSELPERVPGLVRDFFGVPLSVGEIDRMLGAARFDAKRPSLNFECDSSAKQRAATPEVKELATTFLQPVYERLEQIRHGQKTAVGKSA